MLASRGKRTEFERQALAHLDALYGAAYRQVLRGKWKSLEAGADTPNRFSGRSEDGYFLVTLAGAQVLSREGSSNPL